MAGNSENGIYVYRVYCSVFQPCESMYAVAHPNTKCFLWLFPGMRQNDAIFYNVEDFDNENINVVGDMFRINNSVLGNSIKPPKAVSNIPRENTKHQGN